MILRDIPYTHTPSLSLWFVRHWSSVASACYVVRQRLNMILSRLWLTVLSLAGTFLIRISLGASYFYSDQRLTLLTIQTIWMLTGS